MLKHNRGGVPEGAEITDRAVFWHTCQHMLLMQQVGILHTASEVTHEMLAFQEDMPEITSLIIQTRILYKTQL